MIPEIANAQSSETARLDFPEPLSWQDEWTIQLLTERYEDRDGVPFMKFTRDLDGRGKVVTLIVPRALRRIGYGSKNFDANSFATEAPSAVRLPEGTGASNG